MQRNASKNKAIQGDKNLTHPMYFLRRGLGVWGRGKLVFFKKTWFPLSPKKLCLLLLMVLTGCAGGSGKGRSFSAFQDATPVAEVIAGRLAQEYPPAQTSLFFMTSESAFQDALETACRQAGFTLLQHQDSQAITVRYVVDTIKESQPEQGYIYLETSTGLSFARAFTMADYGLANNYTEGGSYE